MRTLADMTPEERAQYRGMWGDHTFWGLVLISITDGVQFRGVNVEVIRFIDGRPMREWASTSEVTPRPDLPRAWAPDGTPPAGQWEHGTRPHKVHISPHNITLDGIPLLHSDEAITIETLETDLHRVRLTVYADYIQLDEDSRPGHNTPGLSWEWETV